MDSNTKSGQGPDSNHEFFNKTGLIFLMLSMIVVAGVFAYVIERNPGPIDDKWSTLIAVGISHDDIVKRENGFRKSSPEAIETGKQLYSINCVGCHSSDTAHAGEDYIMKRLQNKQAKMGEKETDLYRVIFRGIPLYGDRLTQTMQRQDSISSPNRWALVHYMRSIIPDAPAANASDWKALDEEKIW